MLGERATLDGGQAGEVGLYDFAPIDTAFGAGTPGGAPDEEWSPAGEARVAIAL
jgi:hypothetical protein